MCHGSQSTAPSQGLGQETNPAGAIEGPDVWGLWGEGLPHPGLSLLGCLGRKSGSSAQPNTRRTLEQVEWDYS